MGIRKNRTSCTSSFFFVFVYFENLKLYYNFKNKIMKTLQNVQNLTFNEVQVNFLIEFPDDLCTIDSIRNDGKIYFSSIYTNIEYTTTLEQINRLGWKITNPE
jgi:hypothetical protein